MDWHLAIYETFSRLESRWVPYPLLDPDFYDYNPWPIRDFIEAMEIAGAATDGREFMDVGCGIGTKLALMNSLGWTVYGIDWYEPHVTAAQELLHDLPDAQVVLADLRDVESFDADVVYLYRPAKADDLEEQIERHLVNHCAPGTVLVIPETEFTTQFGLEQLGPNVWRR